MSEDDIAMLAMAAAKMSTASIAQMMGISEASVYNRLPALKAERAAGEAAVLRHPAPAAPRPEPSPVLAPPAPAEFRQHRPPIMARRAPEARRYNPVSPEKLRYAGWFRAAGWRLDSIAHLFDLEPQDLEQAFDDLTGDAP